MFDLMSLLGLIPLLCGVVAVVVLYRASVSGAQRAWLAVGGMWSVWLFSVFLVHHTTGPHVQMWWWHVAHAGLSFLPYVLVRTVMPGDRTGVWGGRAFFAFGVMLVLSFTFGVSFLDGAYVVDGIAYLVPGLFHHALAFALAGSFAWSIAVLYQRFRDVRTSSHELAKVGATLVWVPLLALATAVSMLPMYGFFSYHPLVSCAVFIPLMLAATHVSPKPHHIRLILAISFALLYGAVFWMLLFSPAVHAFDPGVPLFLFGIAFLAALYHMHRLSLDEMNREKGERLARYLANANARLRDLDKQKTEFVSLASHQLRSPIAAIRGYTSMMLEGTFGKVPAKLQDPLVRVFRSGQHLSSVVDDFLNVTRIEQGRLSYHFQNLDLSALVSEVVNDHLLAAKTKSLDLTIDASSDQEALVYGDDTKLRQVFSNMLENAIKYTEHGFVRVALQVFPEQHSVTVIVSDSGVGIPVGEQERLFNKFIRASNANDGTVYGSGLGLYIAREIVHAHNGWIHVASPGVGKGSTFTIELPLVRKEHGEESV